MIALDGPFDTIRALRNLKKRYQRLAERRAKTIAEVYSLVSRSISELDDSEIPSTVNENN